MIVGERVNNILYSCVRFLAITKSSYIAFGQFPWTSMANRQMINPFNGIPIVGISWAWASAE